MNHQIVGILMSYKLKVLSDYPLAFWPAESVSGSGLMTYQDLIDTFDTYQDFVNAFGNYAEAGGSLTEDISGSSNSAIYNGTYTDGLLPLVPGFIQSAKLTGSSSILYPVLNDYAGTTNAAGFGTSNSSDNDFTLECWAYFNTSSELEIPLVGDAENSVGLFYDNKNIVFKLNSEQISWTIPYLKKSFHIVASYTGSKAYLYIDGVLEEEKTLSNFTFSNTSLNLSSGPVSNLSDYMLINCIAVYRYSLGLENVKAHYDLGQSINPVEVVYPDGGELFNIYDDALSTKYSYSYPATKSWDYFLNNDLYYDNINNAIRIAYGSGISKTVTIEDFITIPSAPEMDNSRIEWYGDNGISVETSIDGITYVSCTNGQPIPQYSLDSFDTSRDLYIKITMQTTDDSKYLPKLYTLSMSFYNDQAFYANNSSAYISTNSGGIGLSNSNEYTLLSRDSRNGIAVQSGGSFYINTNTLTKSLEFFYTPSDLNGGGLVESLDGSNYDASSLAWPAGTLSKTNIDKIYVNGLDKSSQTDVHNVFTKDQLQHVVITFTEPISGAIKMNYSTTGAISALYQNIALYNYSLTASQVLEHFNLYLGNSSVSLQNALMSVTENSISYYNYDWKVVENI